VFDIQKEAIVFRRLIAIAYLNMLGFTRFDVGSRSLNGNLTIAMLAVDRADPSIQLDLTARLDFSDTARWTSTNGKRYNNSFMANFEPSSPLPLYRMLQTTLETCLRHTFPLIWVRIQCPKQLVADDRLRSMSNIVLMPTAEEADLWVLVAPTGGWDAASYRFQKPKCTKPMLQTSFETYLARVPYTTTLTIHDVPALTNLMPSEREAVHVKLGDGSQQYQFHMRSCAKLDQVLSSGSGV
jgi:hypothetical protein